MIQKAQNARARAIEAQRTAEAAIKISQEAEQKEEEALRLANLRKKE